MANYTAADIKALRERTGAGMLDVKKALDEAGGDADKALEIIRVKGLKGVAKREGRSTSEGLVAVDIRDTEGGQVATLIELNSETDFVAKNDTFISLADRVLKPRRRPVRATRTRRSPRTRTARPSSRSSTTRPRRSARRSSCAA